MAEPQLKHDSPLHLDAHGVYRVAGTRVTLESVIHAFLDGASPEEIVFRFDSLSLPDVYSTISYYLQNQQALDEYLERSEEESAAVREKIEMEWGRSDLRKRLLAKRDKADDRGVPLRQR